LTAPFALEFAGQAGLVVQDSQTNRTATVRRCHAELLIMNKQEIAAGLRTEVGHLEAAIKKLQDRCERLKTFVLDLEAEIAGPETQKSVPDSQFRKVIDQVFGENPRRPKR
jgi:hypothetical protein